MKRPIKIAAATCLLISTLWSQAGRAVPLDPSAFTSLGASPFAQDGMYTIDASMNNPNPTLSGPGIPTPIGGVFHSPSGGSVADDEIAVFTFDSIDIPAGVTVKGTQNADSRPIALLSQGKSTGTYAPHRLATTHKLS
jgi:hypothetical protein